jgi:hypothetical protein
VLFKELRVVDEVLRYGVGVEGVGGHEVCEVKSPSAILPDGQ